MTIDELQGRLTELNGKAHDLRTRAEGENRDLTAEEAGQLEEYLDEFDRCRADIERLERLNAQTTALVLGRGRKTEPAPPQQGDGERNLSGSGLPGARRQDLTVPASPAPDRGNGGFRTLGEMAYHVARASREGAVADPRLQRLAAASTYGNESSGSDGGFAVPPDFRSAIMETVMGEGSLLSRCDQITVAGNTFTQPVDETTPWQTSGGIQAYWTAEAAAKTQSKPLLGERTVKLHKLACIVPMTDELLEDAPAMDAYLRRKAPEKMRFAADLAVLQGNGVGKPLGVLSGPAVVSVAKESGQVADTLIANNVIKMYSRMYAPSRSRAVWVINQDIEPQLLKLSLPGTDNTGNAVTGWGGLVYLPANGLSGSPFGTLFGRPVIPSQAAETLGDQGDINFIDFSQYLALLKSGPNPRVDVSMHFWFDQDLTAFRFVMRIGGVPWWSAAVSARDGAATYSPYVTLAERA